MPMLRIMPLLLFLCLICSFLPSLSGASLSSPPAKALLLPPDAVGLLAFKSSADAGNRLQFSTRRMSLNDHCRWQGVKCDGGRVVRVLLEGFQLNGSFAPDTLTRLDQLRILSLKNNSIAGPIPDLSGLINLKSLFLDHNSFSGGFPPSVLALHRIRTVDLSANRLTGPIPPQLAALDHLSYLRLDSNGFNGSVPPFNQSSLRVLNVSENGLSGVVPFTALLSALPLSAFSGNPALCGVVVHLPCLGSPPFFSSSIEPSPPQGTEDGRLEGVVVPPPGQRKVKGPRRTAGVITGICAGALSAAVLLAVVLLGISRLLKGRAQRQTSTAASALSREEEDDKTAALEDPKKEALAMDVGKSGSLIFCGGEVQSYTLEQLMRASAEVMGRGTVGTTYKAAIDSQLIVSVKRLDAAKMAVIGKEAFDRHLEAVGNLRHPNLVALRAFFQAKEERLLVYDYQPNGSLFSLLHGTKSARGKPLHWTSCLKIAEDVAQGLAYIHQASRLVHGNLRSSNVLLGSDFEACLTDYCLTTLVELSSDDFDTGYRAPETWKSSRRASPKSDVFGFGILLLEIITGRPPMQQPQLAPPDMITWVHSVREEDMDEESHLWMLVNIATSCICPSPEQRPSMWQVLKMIQEVKESEMEDRP